MCSNFGMNLHPGRKPAALQWEWYNFFTRLHWQLRRRFFPRASYMHEGGNPPRTAAKPPAGRGK